MRNQGCSGCELGFQKNFQAPVVYRGKPSANKMIIGEAPGFYEDKDGKPFTGPAGKLMDKIFASVGWNTEQDWYLTNVVKCRPVASPGMGKQNLTPTSVHRDACFPYIKREIEFIKPSVVAVMGKSAASSLLGTNLSMKKLAGRIMYSDEFPGVTFFIMYHPAALLHSQNYPEKYQELRQKMWEDIQKLRTIADESD